MNGDDIILRRTEDLFTKCERYAGAVFGPFMDEAQQALVTDEFGTRAGFNTMLWGGSPECERRIMGVFPEWEEADADLFPIKCVRIEHRFGDALSHRQYLGSMLGLGIDRSKTGDIFISGNTAYAFVHEDIASFVADNLDRVGRIAVKAELCGTDNIKIPEREFKVIQTVAASPRADAVIAAALNVSRSEASKLIAGGCISIDHRPLANASKQLAEGVLISAKGYGRYILAEYGPDTRSGRTHITVKKYI